ncbi:MAG: hypothetical protein V3R99_09690 [Thermoguttaceae bacterium]
MSHAVLLAVSLSCVGQAADDADAREKLVNAWLEVCMSHAKDYRIHPVDKPKEELNLLPKAVFRHHQPVRGNDIGGMYVWVGRDGRPGVLGNIFVYSRSAVRDGSRNAIHEIQSLADVPLAVAWRERSHRFEAVFPWTPIPNAPQPAASSAERTRQVRLLSRRFQGHSIDRSGARWELRLIPRPLYLYETKEHDTVLGGALFALCQGTDVEIVLAIEARRTAQGYRWHYGCGDFSDYRLFTRLDDDEVWSSPGTHLPGVKWAQHVNRIKLPQDGPESSNE